MKTMPNEGNVMEVAAQWSVDPSRVKDDDVSTSGIYGRSQAI
jgi:hypothetical protein